MMTDSAPPTTGNLAIALLRNLLFGVRTALLLRVPLDRVATGWMPIACALVLGLLPWFISQRLEVGPDGEFSAIGLPGIWFPFVLIVLASTAAARLLGNVERTGQLLLALMNANIAIDGVVCALALLTRADTVPGFDVPGFGWLSFDKSGLAGYYIERFGDYLVGCWLGFALAVLLLRLRGWRSVRSWPVAIGAGALLVVAMSNVWQSTTLWTGSALDPQVGAGLDAAAAFDEDLLYQQSGLLNDQLRRLRPGVPGAANLYFLGVAGDSAQKVFLREIRSVQQIMLGRFARREHSLLLVNNDETLRFEPVATVTSIRAAAARFAEVMDRDNDILFVYLTSHGSQEEGFSLNLPPLRLRSLQPAELREILDEAGIRWRVIVVSACYSGVFVKPLENDATLVITAAAADRTSFGCADENDYTYFGRAYFEEALARTDSFIEAFELARGIVTEREQAEGETPSQPQISLGREMRAKLETLPVLAPRPLLEESTE